MFGIPNERYGEQLKAVVETRTEVAPGGAPQAFGP